MDATKQEASLSASVPSESASSSIRPLTKIWDPETSKLFSTPDGGYSYRQGPRCDQAPYGQLHFPHQADEPDLSKKGIAKPPIVVLSLSHPASSVSASTSKSSSDDNATNLSNPTTTAARGLLITRKGRKFSKDVPHNQDRAVLLAPMPADKADNSNNNSKDPSSGSPGKPAERWNWCLAGLFDGHGTDGHVVAEGAVRDLFFRLLPPPATATLSTTPTKPEKEAATEAAPSRKASKNAVDDEDDSVVVPPPSWWSDIITAWDASSPVLQSSPEAGCTALWAWQHGSRVQLVSVGDSVGFVARYNPKTGRAAILVESVQHKPKDTKERARIEAAGGTVHVSYDGCGHVVMPSPAGELYMAMSRALGDMDCKKAGVLIAEPSIVSVDLAHHDADDSLIDFVVLASDGLTDKIPLPKLAERLGKAYAVDDQDPSANALEDLSLALLSEADFAWLFNSDDRHRDDITLLTFRVRSDNAKHGKSRKRRRS